MFQKKLKKTIEIRAVFGGAVFAMLLMQNPILLYAKPSKEVEYATSDSRAWDSAVIPKEQERTIVNGQQKMAWEIAYQDKNKATENSVKKNNKKETATQKIKTDNEDEIIIKEVKEPEENIFEQTFLNNEILSENDNNDEIFIPKEVQEQQIYSPDTPMPMGEIEEICKRVEIIHGVPSKLLMSIIMTESKGCPGAVNGVHIGLMQINKNLFKKIAAEEGVLESEMFDPYNNILLGGHHLKDLIETMGSEIGAVMAYHDGEGGAKSKINNGITRTLYTDTVYNYYESF